jgi:hypothetical protein
MPRKIKRPAPFKPATPEDLAEALKNGDSADVADVLHRSENLGSAECKLLAEHFVGNPSSFFPFRLEFVRRRRGRPSDQFQNMHDYSKVKRTFPEMLVKNGKFNSAVDELAKKTAVKRSRATRFIKAARDSK